MPQRLPLILLVLALLALTCSRTGGASATPAFSDRDDAQLVAARQIQFIAYARVLLGVPPCATDISNRTLPFSS